MKPTDRRFRLIDALYLALTGLPVLAGILLRVLTRPLSEGVQVTGARVFFAIPMPLQDFLITESQVHSVIAICVVTGLCLYLTHGLTSDYPLKRRHFAEMIVEKVDSLVLQNMGAFFAGFAPFIIAMIGLSAVSSLLSLFGLFPPTSDINIVGGWALLVFLLITYYKMKAGVLCYLKSFTQPVPLLTPINLISEVATPVSMAFRHYGNVLSGVVISVLLSSALGGLSSAILQKLPGVFSGIPILRVGIPAVLSVYFDLFSGCLQAFIFAMLTMMYVAGGFPAEEYEKRILKKQKRARTTCESVK